MQKRLIILCASFFSALALGQGITACGQSLTFDLQATGVTGDGVISNGGQTVTLGNTGDVVTVSLYEIINDATSGDGVYETLGSFHNAGSLTGNFTGDVPGSNPSTTNDATGFNSLSYGSQSGYELNNGNGLDLGRDTAVGTPPVAQQGDPATPYFVAHAENLSNQVVTGTVSNGQTYVLVGVTTFTLASNDANGVTTLEYIPHYATGATARNQQFLLNGTYYSVNYAGVGKSGTTNFSGTTNASIVLAEENLTIDFATPEPASLGLLAFGGLALMRRRRINRSGVAKM